MKDIGPTLRQYRRDKNLSQDELAEKVGISRNYLSQIERGVATNLSFELAQRLSDELGIPLSEEPEPQNIPDTLRAFAEQEALQPADVRMLATIQYRGERPASVEEWRLLHLAIKAVTVNRRTS